MIQIILCLVLQALAGACYAVCWKLQFHYDRSVFATFSRQTFWNPDMSWENKWKLNREAKPGDHRGVLVGVERFWGSSRWFVFTTDAFHLFQFYSHWLAAASVAILVADNAWQFALYLVALRFIYSGTFALFFDVLLKRKS